MMLNAYEYATATELHEAVCTKLMFGTEYGVDYDWTHGTEVGLHNVVLGARSFDWEFDLKRLWLGESRWNTMVRQYLDPDAVDHWKHMVADRLKGAGRGIAVLRTNNVQGRGEGRNVRRRWGSCMLSFSFRSNPIPTITLHSRTTYFGYLAAMDMTVAHVLASEASEITGIPVEDMQFVWNLELAQFHGFRSLAWALGNPDIKARMDRDVPNRLEFPTSYKAAAAKGTAVGYRKALDGYARLLKSDMNNVLYGDESFSSFCRVRRRFHAEVMGGEYAARFNGGNLRGKPVYAFGPLPSKDIWDLDLSPLGRSGPFDDLMEADDDE